MATLREWAIKAGSIIQVSRDATYLSQFTRWLQVPSNTAISEKYKQMIFKNDTDQHDPFNPGAKYTYEATQVWTTLPATEAVVRNTSYDFLAWLKNLLQEDPEQHGW